MIQVNIHEAKTNLSKLLKRVEEGEDVVIAKAGEPIARLVPERRKGGMILGGMKGRIWIADDFNAPLDDELLDLFEGKNDKW